MVSISVISCIWHWKLEFCTKSSCTNSFSMCMSPSFIIGGHAAMHSLPCCFFILWWFWCLWTEQAADKHITAECCASMATSPLLPQDAFPARPGLLWISQRGLQEGLSLLRLKQHGRTGKKPSPLQNLAVFPKERLSLFFPFKKILVKGVLVENGKTQLCSWACDQVWLQTEKINVLSVSARATVKATGKVEAFSHYGST